RRRPVSLSVGIFLAGAFSEELWIAFCLVVLKSTGHSTLSCVGLTAIVFGIVHYQYHFSGAFAVALKGAASALLFLWSGSLVATFSWHFVGNLGSLYIARRGLLEARRTADHASS
ncbi:MAG: CPBP family intramembrane glutamic endopeptidase, partial [Xanthobacteraceae bacterium]